MADITYTELSDYLENSEYMHILAAGLKRGKNMSVDGVSADARGAFLRALKNSTGRRIVYVCRNGSYEAADGAERFPSETIQLHVIERRSRDSEIKSVGMLLEPSDITVIDERTLLKRFPPRCVLESRVFSLRPGNDIKPEDLASGLIEAGYERTETVYAPGEFSRRGEIFDVYPCGSPLPVRIVFFDTEIETLKTFDADTRKTIEPVNEVRFLPASLYMLNESEKEKALRYFDSYTGEDSAFGAEAAAAIVSITETGTLCNMDSFCSEFTETVSFFDYTEDSIVVFDSLASVRAAAVKYYDDVSAAYEKLYRNGEAFFAQKNALFCFDEVLESVKGAYTEINSLNSTNPVDFKMRAPALFSGNIPELAESLKERMRAGWTVVMCVGAKARSLSKALLEYDVIAPVNGSQAKITCSESRLVHGAEITGRKVLYLGEGDIYTVVKKTGRRAVKFSDASDDELFAELKAGDIVVHEVHGKGRYLGLKTMEAAGSTGEYLELEYRDGDRLYIPSAQIGRIQKYIGSADDESPQLSKLGTKQWESAKNRARESVKKLAFDLVRLYSDRYARRGYAFSADGPFQTQFEDCCEYELTEGQDKSIREIKADMESSKVMDRLVLGDVGYGKTEVAMRAAFKAVSDSKQVCMLVPTTLLARQHGETFRKRFDGFPVRIAVLSRYTGKSEREILSRISSGDIDIVIGTHKLLSDSVRFADLGLLIVDEEQRFGVGHKEKIKLFKENVDVITLSATPIPRTLEMSLTGVRDLSMIKTPPADRKEPVSYVMKYSESLVEEAVRREMARGGQVYFVVRQIQQMSRMLAEISRLVPEARIGYAHGRMTSQETEAVVGDFLDGKTDVLLSTTIIESGIDIPSVNTIIIYEADKFGLSQLYQLRGRVGRSSRTAYAYFTFLSEYMGETAKKRLLAIKEFTSLGSGFKIAMRDLQIRGAGNLLGPEQSGHMVSVGYSLYCRMMRQAVESARGNETCEEQPDTTVNLGVPAYIPSEYISDDSHKLDMYRRIAGISSVEDAKKVRSELEDIYGEIPSEVGNLIVCAVVRKYAASCGIASLIRKGRETTLIYDREAVFSPEKLMNYLYESRGIASLKPTEPPQITVRAANVKALLTFISGLKHCK